MQLCNSSITNQAATNQRPFLGAGCFNKTTSITVINCCTGPLHRRRQYHFRFRTYRPFRRAKLTTINQQSASKNRPIVARVAVFFRGRAPQCPLVIYRYGVGGSLIRIIYNITLGIF